MFLSATRMLKRTCYAVINFTAKPGETTAIIGSTGSGKSTVVNLIPRFFDVTEGAIFVDGVDIREVKQSDLRDKIGYIPQRGCSSPAPSRATCVSQMKTPSPETLAKGSRNRPGGRVH